MNPTAGRRILAAFDARRQDALTVERAVALAAGRRAELVALVVEDESLLRLAGLPFAREIRADCGGERSLDPMTTAAELQRQTERLRRTVTLAARRRQVAFSVQVTRGQFARAALATAAGCGTEMVLFNVFNRGPVAVAAAAPVKPVWVVFERTPASRRALGVAAELAVAERRELRLLLAGNGPPGALRAAATEALADTPASGRVVSDRAATIAEVRAAIRRRGASLLLLGQDSALAGETGVRDLLDGADCALALVR